MASSMTRGKQQILLNYLPGKTFDFERGPISRVTEIRGTQITDLNEEIVIEKIGEIAKAWSDQYRPALGNHVLDDPSKFVLVNPHGVEAEIYPKVFWCQNLECGKIADYTSHDGIPPSTCPRCKSGKLIQLRFIKVHRCGTIAPLVPSPCPKCKSRDLALNTRGSERLAEFRWVCTKCGHRFRPFGGSCPACEWPEGGPAKFMQIEVHRAGRTYYPQTAVLLNIPSKELEGLLRHPDWDCIVAAKFLGLSAVKDIRLTEIVTQVAESSSISADEIESALDDTASAEEALEKLRNLIGDRESSKFSSVDDLCNEITTTSGISRQVWKRARSDILECIIPFEGTSPKLLTELSGMDETSVIAASMGIAEVALVQDYTIINATMGYSRVDYQPNSCWLNPFPPDPSYQGRLPIYVDRVQADAIILSLNPETVIAWLERNGISPAIPQTGDRANSVRAHFVDLFDEVTLLHSIGEDEAELRMVFGLLHTLSHVCIRQAALLCGLEKTSISEYLLPRSLSFAIYCNHRFGSAIGALTALFEQSLSEWLGAISATRNCVYDPVCHDHEGSCHACTHLAETSCRFFNLNLSRAFLFGGTDREIGSINCGYLDFGDPHG